MLHGKFYRGIVHTCALKGRKREAKLGAGLALGGGTGKGWEAVGEAQALKGMLDSLLYL